MTRLVGLRDVFLLETRANLLEREPDGAGVRFSEILPEPGKLVMRPR